MLQLAMRWWIFAWICGCLFAPSCEGKSLLTLDDFFSNTDFTYLSYSPTGQHLLMQTKRPLWEANAFETSSWLFDVTTRKRRLIIHHRGDSPQPTWSPSGDWIAFLTAGYSTGNGTNEQNDSQKPEKTEHFIYLYAVLSDKIVPVSTGSITPSALTWSESDSSIYVAGVNSESSINDQNEWKDVIRYRQLISNYTTAIIRIDQLSSSSSPTETISITTVPFLIGQLILAPKIQKLVLTSAAYTDELSDAIEIYSIDLGQSPSLSRLTNNDANEIQLQLAHDGTHVLFMEYGRVEEGPRHVQIRLYSLDLVSGHVERLAKDFFGSIAGYAVNYQEGGVYVVEQRRTELHVYIQRSSTQPSIRLDGWNGTYELLTSSPGRLGSLAFVYSSFEQAEEVYLTDRAERISSAKAITNENEVFLQRDLPKAEVYQWRNKQDNQTIEGILHYPPNQFRAKNLPLLILIHGGPFAASVNGFQAGWYQWAPLAATYGWLVLEPNYLGSSGYGDQFVSDLLGQPVSRPGRDILAAVDQLTEEGTVDPHQLAVGGYSYGGFITNWLITQTTRFNAALSGSGAVDHLSAWGTMDLPGFYQLLFGALPWVVPSAYPEESPIYHLDKVQTPTHIVTGEDDVRVNADQSYILERGLHYLQVPTQLLVFPKEGHGLEKDPWHGKIKVREELKWLEKYGHTSWLRTRDLIQ